MKSKVYPYDEVDYLTGIEARKERASLLRRLREDEQYSAHDPFYKEFRKDYVLHHRWKNVNKN